jgi:hypothetical protein
MIIRTNGREQTQNKTRYLLTLTFIVYTLGGEEAACRPAGAEEQEQHQDQGGSSKNHPHCQGSARAWPPRQRVQELAPCSNMEARVRPRRGRIMQPFSSHRTKLPVAVEAWKGCRMRDASALRSCQYANDTKEDASALAASKQEHKRRGRGREGRGGDKHACHLSLLGIENYSKGGKKIPPPSPLSLSLSSSLLCSWGL